MKKSRKPFSSQKKLKTRIRATRNRLGTRSKIQVPCSIRHICGACAWQEIPYAEQLKQKHQNLIKSLSDLCTAKSIQPVQGLTEPFGYRTRLLMPASLAYRQQPPFVFGFCPKGATKVIDATGCPVQHPLTLAVLAMTKQALATTAITATAAGSKHGWLHGIAVRVDSKTLKAELTLVGRTLQIPGGKYLGAELATLPGVDSVHLSINPSRSSYLLGENFVHLGGQRRTLFHIGGQTFVVSPGSFMQTNAEATELLIQQVLAAMPDKFSILADLYGGMGVFARVSVARWQHAMVVENNKYAIGDFRKWTTQHQSKSVASICSKVEDEIEEVLEEKPDVILLDPPRRGCHLQVISAIAQSHVPIVIYVACGQEALVRDSSILQKAGYQIDRVSSVDMFPHTSHLESVVRFVR